FLFFFNHTSTTEIYTLSLHDALPISESLPINSAPIVNAWAIPLGSACTLYENFTPICEPSPSSDSIIGRSRGVEMIRISRIPARSEEHTSELQSRGHLVCRLLLEKKK